MKRHVQEPGIRKWSGDDLIELQSEGLLVADKFFAEQGNCVITGCEVLENGISDGLVSIDGLLLPFEAVTDIEVFPVYLVKDERHIQREYADDVVRDIAVEYFAKMVQQRPAEGGYIEVTEEGISRFFDNLQSGITGKLKALAFQDKIDWNTDIKNKPENLGRKSIFKNLTLEVDNWEGSEESDYYGYTVEDADITENVVIDLDATTAADFAKMEEFEFNARLTVVVGGFLIRAKKQPTSDINIIYVIKF